VGPCLCGDPCCGSCGPAQGYDPVFETNIEDWDKELVAFLEEKNDAELSDILDSESEGDTLAILRYHIIDWAHQKWNKEG
jgi:hypothetical protein